MWGIAVIIAACCLAFGAVDAAAKMHERKAQSDSFDSSDSCQESAQISEESNFKSNEL